ncbi:hypothetical protein L7F22_014618 [Adiantum nelumboides]|nr:hypothetical protein [Adiantum nelumboides]
MCCLHRQLLLLKVVSLQRRISYVPDTSTAMALLRLVREGCGLLVFLCEGVFEDGSACLGDGTQNRYIVYIGFWTLDCCYTKLKNEETTSLVKDPMHVTNFKPTVSPSTPSIHVAIAQPCEALPACKKLSPKGNLKKPSSIAIRKALQTVRGKAQKCLVEIAFSSPFSHDSQACNEDLNIESFSSQLALTPPLRKLSISELSDTMNFSYILSIELKIYSTIAFIVVKVENATKSDGSLTFRLTIAVGPSISDRASLLFVPSRRLLTISLWLMR